MPSSKILSAAVAALLFGACQGAGASGGTAPDTPSEAPPETPSEAAPDTQPPPPAGWQTARLEDFDSLASPEAAWAIDPVPDDGPYSDAGAYFRNLGIVPPPAYRATAAFGDRGWLTAESYTRSGTTRFSELVSVVPDPAGGQNRVLRVASPAHTDGTVIRSSEPLPSRYRISLRVGFPSFGDGRPGLNGYDGNETAEPWSTDSAISQNGFYWLTILDAMPRPHNNTWIHHHRKVVIDSDNHFPAWMQIFDGQSFLSSGENPIMMFALDGKGADDPRTGKPFMAWSADAWQPSGAIRAVDAYLPGEWYDVSIERFDSTFTLSISGKFKYGGQNTYRATLDAAEKCVWHFNRAGEDASACAVADWDPTQSWPDWFMFGDPHTNYYEGEVYYDDVRLEVWQAPAA